MNPSVIIRADGSLGIGHGHIFRTLVLVSELFTRGWKVSYVCRDLEGAPLARIRDDSHGLHLLAADMDEAGDAAATGEIAREAGASWIVVDRYATDDQAHRLWREQGFKILAIDDICEYPFPVDILLNQNANAKLLNYRTDEDTVSLLGPEFALIREAYCMARPSLPRNIGKIKNVMVFMGGGDPEDATGRVLESLEFIGGKLCIEVIVGAAYPHLEKLISTAEKSHHHVEVFRNLSDLVAPMRRAQVAIAAGGSVTWELCCMGVPLLLMPIAANQEGIASEMERIGAAKRLDENDCKDKLEIFLNDPNLMNDIGKEVYSLVDGLGAERVARELEKKNEVI